MWEYILILVIFIILISLVVTFTDKDISIIKNPIIYILIIILVFVVIGVYALNNLNNNTIDNIEENGDMSYCGIHTFIAAMVIGLLILGSLPVLSITCKI